MINQNKILSIDKFIEKALYDKNFGYYSKKNPFGKKGDYVTAPMVSPLFTEMISIWVISYWIKLGKPKSFSFVELGPGNGVFCKMFCTTLKNFPEFKNSVKIFLLEKKTYKIQKLIKEQKYWIKNINRLKMDQFFFLEMSFLILYQLNNSKLKNLMFTKNLFS